MASPQTENGYTKIAHELLEAMCRDTGVKNKTRVWLAILRITYGYHTKNKTITYKDIQKITEITHKPIISKCIKELADENKIVFNKNDKRELILGIQKNYDKWKTSSNNELTEVLTQVNKSVNSGLTEVLTHVNKSVNSNDIKPITAKDLLSLKDNFKDSIKDNSKDIDTNVSIEFNNSTEKNCQNILDFWNKIVGTIKGLSRHKSLDSIVYVSIQKKEEVVLRNIIAEALKVYSPTQIKKAIINYTIVFSEDKYYYDIKWNLGNFIYSGIHKKTGLIPFLNRNLPLTIFDRSTKKYTNKVLTIDNWKPVTKDNLINRNNLYFGFPFALVKQNVYDIKENVDDAYYKYSKSTRPSHFEWLEELLATLKYQRSSVTKDINVDKYLQLWKTEKEKPKVQKYIKDINNE